jgi:fatty-acyl-CoA synthase
MSKTLVEAIAALPRGEARGFRFLTLAGEEHYHPYAQLTEQAQRRAAKLLALGLSRGDRVAIAVAEPEEFVFTFLGATLAGIVPVPICSRQNFSFRTKNAYLDTVDHILRASGSRILVAEEESLPVLDELRQRDTGLEAVVVLSQRPEESIAGFVPADVSSEDICFLQFTSGSTSLPKGVVVTHGNLVANAQAIFGPKGLDKRDDDVHLAWLPLYHDMGLIGFVLGPLICDLPTVLLPTAAFARRPTLWMASMHKYRGTITYAPNFAYALAAKRTRDSDLEGLDLSHVRITGCGAEPIQPRVLRSFCDRFAPAGFRPEAMMPSYGMAEGTLAITFHQRATPMVTDSVNARALSLGQAIPAAPVSEGSVELMSCGVPFPGHDVRIVDELGWEQPERRVGEIVTRGPSVTRRYFNHPEATAQTFKGGWLHTGDLGYLADGNLYVCGRIKDLIIINGVNHYPQDIEWAAAEVQGVRANSVVAFSTLRGGEEALVVCVEAHARDAAALRRAIAAQIAEGTGLQVGHVCVVRPGSLPQTSSGKVQRRKTKELYEKGELVENNSDEGATEPAVASLGR